jgi:DNA-directed RNA polymerase specialized sigma24 family protein
MIRGAASRRGCIASPSTSPFRFIGARRVGRARPLCDEQAVLQISPQSRESEAAPRDTDWQLLESFIRQLNEFDRALVILYLDGNRHETIAEILGISETNVATRIGRIKHRLRQMGAADEGETVSHGTR